MKEVSKEFRKYRPHPWHGLEPGENPPERVRAYIEITPFSVIKFEIDKETGYLLADRPQRSSSLPPCLYGIIPRTLAGPRVHALCPKAERGDGDPMDICVISERTFDRIEVLVNARVVGGIQMIDQGEADDKIVAIMQDDVFFNDVEELDDLPEGLVRRLVHYFSTYKDMPGQPGHVEITETYGRRHAFKIIEASLEDYEEAFGE